MGQITKLFFFTIKSISVMNLPARSSIVFFPTPLKNRLKFLQIMDISFKVKVCKFEEEFSTSLRKPGFSERRIFVKCSYILTCDYGNNYYVHTLVSHRSTLPELLESFQLLFIEGFFSIYKFAYIVKTTGFHLIFFSEIWVWVGSVYLAHAV